LMRYLCMVVMALGVGWSQVTTYNINNDIAAHTFTLPIPCPSTTGGNCHNSGTQNNQATIGVNSIWAECDFSGSSSYHNPECSGGQLASSSSSAAAAHSQYVHIVLATDANTINSEIDWAGTLSGGAGDQVWSSDATRVVFQNVSGGNIFPFSFDPNPANTSTYMQVGLLYGGLGISAFGSPAFSKVTPKLMYVLENSSDTTLSGLIGTHGVSANEFVIVSYDFTSTITAPTIANSGITFIQDFNTCLTGMPAATGGASVLSVSDDDQTFATNLNGPLGQDSYGKLVIYNRSLGCSWLNTLTGTVTKFGGGTATIVNANSLTGYSWPPEPYIHETQIFHDGGKVFFQGS